MSQHRKECWPSSSQGQVQMSKKHSKSKVPASSMESLSHFFKKKPTETEIYNKTHQHLVEEPTEDEHCKYVDSESPYKNLIKTNTNIVLNDSASDAADFKSPVPTRKPKNILSVLGKPVKRSNKTQKGQSVRGRARRQNNAKKSTAKIITDNYHYFGENPEHIQMGIALSKSSYEAECGSSSESLATDETPNVGEMLRNAKPAFLERFGFTSCRKVLPVENKRLAMISGERNKKKNRFKYITPILQIRTSEERNSLIDSKISLILCQHNPHFKKHSTNVLKSNTLNNYCISRECSIFYLDEIYQRNNFYVKSLEIPHSKQEFGHLLKDWNLIPGRDKSPCKMKNDSADEKVVNSKDQDTTVSSSKHCSKTLNDEQETKTALSEATSQVETIPNKVSPYVKSPVKHLSDTLKLGATCSFSVSAEIQKTIWDSFSTESKDSAIPTSFTTSATSTFNSFDSRCISCVSPDLFGSDDELDKQFLSESCNENTKESLETDESDSVDKFLKNPVSCLKSDEIIISNNAEIIDLTDDDDESSCKSPNISLSSNDIFLEGNDDCISPHKKNQNKKSSSSTLNANLYNLDEFENDYQQYNIKASQENTDRFYRVQDKDEALNNETVNIPEDKKSVSSIDDYERQIAFIKDNRLISDKVDMEGDSNISRTDMEIANDNLSSNVINKSNSFEKSSNKCNIKKTSLSTSSSSKDDNCDNAYIILDSPDSHNIPSDLSNDEDELKDDSSLNNTPKRNEGYVYPSFHKGTLSDISDVNNCSIDTNEKSCFYGTINENSRLETTPKKCLQRKYVGSPCFDELVLHESTNPNVTDYVNNMLDQENFSFDETNPVNDREGYHNVNNEGDMSSSQGSRSSIILDEELNYSSHFATPVRVNNGSRKTMIKYPYNDAAEKTDDIISISPELPGSILETRPHKSISVNTEILPTATDTKQITTPDNFIIKTDNVTPMPEYETMTTPLINKELQKVGVKPLKRTRGAKLLRYIYESTHPVVGLKDNIVLDNSESDEDKRVIKKRKKSSRLEDLNNLECDSASVKLLISSSSPDVSLIEIIGDRIIENEKLEDLVFERKQLTKIASCKVPLQIVWHNLVSSNQTIKENILLYEPLQLESLHIMLKELGFKFHIQDLLTFLDKKCITIRTAPKQGKMHSSKEFFWVPRHLILLK